MVSKVVKKHGKNDGTKKEKRTNRIMHGIGKAISKASKFLAVGIFVAEISGCADGNKITHSIHTYENETYQDTYDAYQKDVQKDVQPVDIYDPEVQKDIQPNEDVRSEEVTDVEEVRPGLDVQPDIQPDVQPTEDVGPTDKDIVVSKDEGITNRDDDGTTATDEGTEGQDAYDAYEINKDTQDVSNETYDISYDISGDGEISYVDEVSTTDNGNDYDLVSLNDVQEVYIDSDSSEYTTSVKEAVLYVNDSNHQKYLEMDGYHFVLDDVQAETGSDVANAIITVTDADGNPVSPDYTRMSIAPGTTKEVTINGKIYKIHVLNTTRGFTSMSATARISVSSQNTES